MTNQEQDENEPLLLEITPSIASDLLAIYQHIPKTETEPTLEEVVAMATSHFRSRLERGETQIVSESDEEAVRAVNARKQSQEGL